MILYFSATGNSRHVAERIGSLIGDDVLNLLPLLRQGDHGPLRSDRPWVFVAPIYVEDIAIVAADWLRSAALEGRLEIYFVFTTASTMGCAGHTAAAIARKKGLEYLGSAEIVMPTNYPLMFTVHDDDANREIIRSAAPAIEAAAEHIARGEPIPEKSFSPVMAKLFQWVGVWFYRAYIKPKRFYASKRCVSCGKCAKVCPMNNIRMNDSHPAWDTRCVHCMACVSACPTEAVEYGRKLIGKRRYHFPKGI